MTTPLTDTQISEIKQLLLDNELTQKEIGKRYGRARSTISDIATNRLYRDVEPKLMPNKIPGGQQKHLNLEQQNLALVGQVENLRQERNLLKRQLRASAKRDAVVDEIVERLAPIIKPMPRLTPVKIKTPSGAKENVLALVFSDVHGDQIVRPEEVDGLEDFDLRICVRRAEVLVHDLIQVARTTFANLKFTKLVIFAIGDFTSGEIHGHVHKSFFGCQFTNDLALAELFAMMFTELAAHFPEIEIVCLSGNHGRLTDKIEYTKEAVEGNHDTLIMKVAQIHCKNIPNINFVFPMGLSCIHEVYGWNFYLHHGHGQRGSSEIWNRAKKKAGTIVPLHRGRVHYLVTGHFHAEGSVRASGGAKLIGNGAFLACDSFSYQALEEASEPCQVIFTIDPKRGASWQLPLMLRTPDEKDGPQRYNLPCLSNEDSLRRNTV